MTTNNLKLSLKLYSNSARELYYKDIKTKHTNSATNNLFLLAKRHIDSNVPTTVEVLNKFLVPFGLFITQSELDILLSIRAILLPLSSDRKTNVKLLRNINGPFVARQRTGYKTSPGVYIFQSNATNNKYVGSSIHLSNRLPVYFTNHTLVNDKRLIIQSLRTEFILCSCVILLFLAPRM